MTPARWIPAGVAAGLALTLWPGAAFILCLALFLGLLLRRFAPPEEKVFLTRLFVAGFLLRITLSAGLDLAAGFVEGQAPFFRDPGTSSGLGAVDRTRGVFRVPDSDDYSERGYALAQYAKGKEDPGLLTYVNNRYGRNAYLYVVGAFYHLFGFSPVTVKWLNGILGALLGPMVFFLARSSFSSSVARSSAVLTAFFPSLVLWSSTNLKEPAFTLLTAALLLLCLRVQQAGIRGRDRLLWGVALTAAALLHSALRVPVYTIALLVIWLLALGITALWKRRLFALLALLAVGVPVLAWPLLERGFATILWGHTSFAYAQGETYRFLPDAYYTEASRMSLRSGQLDAPGAGAVLFWCIQAAAHYLFQPFPWNVRSAWELAAYPQMIFWCFSLIFALWGMRLGLSRGSAVLPALTLFSWTLIGALSNGNVWAVFRFRDMITPLVLIFACAGAWAFVRESEAVTK